MSDGQRSNAEITMSPDLTTSACYSHPLRGEGRAQPVILFLWNNWSARIKAYPQIKEDEMGKSHTSRRLICHTKWTPPNGPLWESRRSCEYFVGGKINLGSTKESSYISHSCLFIRLDGRSDYFARLNYYMLNGSFVFSIHANAKFMCIEWVVQTFIFFVPSFVRWSSRPPLLLLPFMHEPDGGKVTRMERWEILYFTCFFLEAWWIIGFWDDFEIRFL